MEVLCETDVTADISEMSLRVSSALCSSATSSVELEVTGLAVQLMLVCTVWLRAGGWFRGVCSVRGDLAEQDLSELEQRSDRLQGCGKDWCSSV